MSKTQYLARLRRYKLFHLLLIYLSNKWCTEIKIFYHFFLTISFLSFLSSISYFWCHLFYLIFMRTVNLISVVEPFHRHGNKIRSRMYFSRWKERRATNWLQDTLLLSSIDLDRRSERGSRDNARLNFIDA